MNVNVWDVIEPIQGLIRSGRRSTRRASPIPISPWTG